MWQSRTRSSSNFSVPETYLRALALFFLLVARIGWATLETSAPGTTQALFPCLAAEKWNFGSDLIPVVGQPYRDQFAAFLSGKLSPLGSVEQAEALRNTAPPGPGRAFAEYWIGRSFYAMGMSGLAADWFNQLVVQAPEGQQAVAVAAVHCMNVLHGTNRVFSLSDKALARVPSLAQTARLPGEVVVQLFLQQLVQATSPDNLAATLGLLKGNEPFESYARALLALKEDAPERAIPYLRTLVSAPTLPDDLERRRETFQLFLARSLYETKQFPQAADEFKKVGKDSNELVDAMIGLSWAYLMSGNSLSAVGAAVSLESGGLRNTFSPEGLMVIAIAFEEFCMFRQSQKALRLLRQKYQPIRDWLQAYIDLPDEKKPNLYTMAMAFLRDRKLTAPLAVMGEWIRGARFIAYQERINLTFSEARTVTAILAQPGANRLKPVLEQYAQRLQSDRTELVHRIESEFETGVRRMMQDLDRVLDNGRLIEAATLNGVAEDLIFQNVLPKYTKWSKEQALRNRALAAKDVNWSVGGEYGLSGTSEMWEDELGTLRATLVNECANKQRYLKIQAANPATDRKK